MYKNQFGQISKCLISKLAGPTMVGWLCWGLTSQSTIFQSCRDGAIASWVINQYFRGVKCLAQGHNTATVGLEPRTSRSGVRHSTTEPPRSPRSHNGILFSQQGQIPERCPNMRIFNGYEVLIENFVTRVTVRYHEACRVMPNSYPSVGIFSFHRRTIMDSFSCILFLWQLHLDLILMHLRM